MLGVHGKKGELGQRLGWGSVNQRNSQEIWKNNILDSLLPKKKKRGKKVGPWKRYHTIIYVKDLKNSIMLDDIVLYIENLREPTKKLLELINSAGLQDKRPIYKTHLHFYVLAMSSPKMKLRQQAHLQ